jgi:hypothetical protein
MKEIYSGTMLLHNDLQPYHVASGQLFKRNIFSFNKLCIFKYMNIIVYNIY